MPPSTNFPIDAVFTWVDGSDPVWREKKNALLRARGVAVPADADNASRFQDNDELRYALRAVARFAPWLRRVHLVTADQKPAWLNTETVNLVSHADIFPPDLLPVFSTRPIEFCVHRVPGLADHFLYFNDDFMLGRAVKPEDFFLPDGRPLVWAVRRGEASMRALMGKEGAASSHASAVARSHKLIAERFGQNLPYTMRHFPKAMTRATADELWRVFPAEVAATLASPFRAPSDVSVTMLYPLYLLATGQGKLRPVNGWRQAVDLFSGGPAHMGGSLGDANIRRKMACIRLLRPRTYCLNDAPGATDAGREELRRFLARMLPRPCKFEREDCPSKDCA